MNTATEKLLKTFTELCESLIADAYVITDGRSVLTAVLDHELATKLCQVMIDRTCDNSWKVTKIADGLELAYRNGYNQACKDFEKQIERNTDEQDSELRDSELQREEE
jgi:hypothetical protein